MDMDGIGAVFRDLVGRHGVPGAQLAVSGGGQEFGFEVGRCEHGRGRPVARDSRFPIGSITKLVTAAAVVALAGDGDLELDVPVGGLIAELIGTSLEGLTAGQLLSHTSGMASACDVPDRDLRTVRTYLRRCAELDLVQPPGTGFSYSNLGYLVLGRLVEAATGMTWWESVRGIVLQPLGITGSSIVEPDGHEVTGHAVHATSGRVHPIEQTLPVVAAAAGALALSAADLVAFGRVLVPGAGGPVADEQSLAMCTPVPGTEAVGMADGWGLGPALHRAGAVEWWGHDGTAEGTSCHLRVDPLTGVAIAVTTNAGTGLALWHDLVDELGGLGLQVGDATGTSRHVPDGPALQAEECAGVFENGTTRYAITERDGELFYDVDGVPHSVLTARWGSRFTMRDLTSDAVTYAGCFLRNPITAQVDRIQISGRVARRSGPSARTLTSAQAELGGTE